MGEMANVTPQASQLREKLTSVIEYETASYDQGRVTEQVLAEISTALRNRATLEAVATAIYGGSPDAYDVDVLPIALDVVWAAIRASGIERG